MVNKCFFLLMMDWSKLFLKYLIEGLDGYRGFHGSLCKHIKLSAAFDPRIAEAGMDQTGANGIVDEMALEKYENKEGRFHVFMLVVKEIFRAQVLRSGQ